jgi:hypothetical protein
MTDRALIRCARVDVARRRRESYTAKKLYGSSDRESREQGDRGAGEGGGGGREGGGTIGL